MFPLTHVRNRNEEEGRARDTPHTKPHRPMADTTQITMPEKGQDALAWYMETGEVEDLNDWLSTEEGQQYLQNLRSCLPTRLKLYRGLNGVVDDPLYQPTFDNVTNHGNDDSDFEEAPQYDGERDGITSCTDQHLVAVSFATGSRHFVEDPEPYGIVIEKEIPASRVLYHHEYVDADGRFDEAEVTIK